MKQRRIALTLILLLCLTALLSGAHLILHSGDHSHPTACLVCAMLAQNADAFLCLLLAFTGIGLIERPNKRDPNASQENQRLSDRTLVHQKVKLQN